MVVDIVALRISLYDIVDHQLLKLGILVVFVVVVVIKNGVRVVVQFALVIFIILFITKVQVVVVLSPLLWLDAVIVSNDVDTVWPLSLLSVVVVFLS